MASRLNSTRSRRQTNFQPNVPSATAVTEQIQSYFSEIEDPRVQRTRAHLLTDILIIGILSAIAGGKAWEDMENYGLSKLDWLREFLALPNGIPCPDTFRRVFERINPKVFERCFQRWVQSIVETMGAQVIPIDGKTLRGSYDREKKKSALHLVSAWATEHRLVLGQVKVTDKSNEITAIPALLELLDLAGCIITIDAMGTQTAIAAQIHKAHADYVLALKANHPTLHGQIKTWFEQAQALNFEGITFSYDERIEKGHHRTEKRQVWTVPISQLPPLHQQADWLGLKTVVMVVRLRHLWNKITHEVQFYLTSLDSDALILGRAIRLHWGVENGLHWTLDVTFNEDACRVRTGHAPYNLSLLRRIALNALNREQSLKRSNRQKSNRAAMDNNYMLTILAACLSQHNNDASQSACQ
ncbi:ISAs1 family transposase [Nostoc sphaeroides CHAB 2801]|uniref:ISAs1 family transposase n=1 Tax=Nostoc sphaeroides TaxID=446679 RepID=UPI001E56B889|nr:ISAs1 family transposase [Nostoc sphaeroides]MCC5631563.1 ISAs1 family transposase [Nostoc sphaeroides CHAB 2801]MCC5632554.1 ISAs1 family transposase [Nostoc sphaeroides CHAB 2801]MCC5632676.1 ISAs1 family transposase [Nostoc sphaeroides CHAB 2801]MCC5633340.1 ISAs1 family transposase [Nostoc sphaeroides CHAB 2801]MCC5633591.1 ISAs1 family transposase [Nostoc sphaeroides CHAB 2801]